MLFGLNINPLMWGRFFISLTLGTCDLPSALLFECSNFGTSSVGTKYRCDKESSNFFRMPKQMLSKNSRPQPGWSSRRLSLRWALKSCRASMASRLLVLLQNLCQFSLRIISKTTFGARPIHKNHWLKCYKLTRPVGLTNYITALEGHLQLHYQQ